MYVRNALTCPNFGLFIFGYKIKEHFGENRSGFKICNSNGQFHNCQYDHL